MHWAARVFVHGANPAQLKVRSHSEKPTYTLSWNNGVNQGQSQWGDLGGLSLLGGGFGARF